MENLGQLQQMVSTAGQEEELAAPDLVGRGRQKRGLMSLHLVSTAEERAWSWSGLSVQPSLPLSRHLPEADLR